MEAKKIDAFHDDDIREIISESLLFKGADSRVLDLVIENLEYHSISKGTPIFLENELNDKVYFIKSGEVEIVYFQKDFNRMNQATILKAGSYFAELSVLTRGNTSASAIVHRDCELLSLSGDRFLQILSKQSKIGKNLSVNLGKLLSQFLGSHSYITYFDANHIEIEKEILSYLPQTQWNKLKCIPLNLKGKLLSVAAVKPHGIELQRFFKRLKDIKVEIHLISSEDFATQSELLAGHYRHLRGAASSKRKVEKCIGDLKDVILNQSELFATTPGEIKKQVSDYLEVKRYRAGDLIFNSKSAVDSFYVVASGEVTILKEVEGSSMLANVSTIKALESFGILPILLSGNRCLTAVATTEVELVKVPKKIFISLMGKSYFAIEVAKCMALMIQNANKHSGLEYFASTTMPDFESVSITIPWNIITDYKVIPIEQSNNQITLGVVNPDKRLFYSTLGRYLANLKVNFFILSEDQYRRFLPKYKTFYERNAFKQRNQGNRKISTIDLVDEILATEINLRASDVHIEPNENRLVVRYRVDGVLRESNFEILYPDPGVEILSRIKIMAEMDISNKLTPQDGQIHQEINGVELFARASVMPLKNGEKMVLRLVSDNMQVPPLSSLTTDRSIYQILQKVVKCRQGLFLVTGPTGSGKTTTLYSILHELNGIESNVITVEDPVEFEIPGINQLEINVKQDMTFEKALKAILRQDPDCIMIGEIRDKVSAQIALEAAMTGHLVLSTIHTASSLDVIPRLRDLGIEKSLISSGLIGAMTQKLVRTICPHCVEERAMESEEKQFIEQFLQPHQIPEKLKMGKGCTHCNNTGYKGRIPVFEGWSSNKQIQDLVCDDAHLSIIKENLQEHSTFHDIHNNAIIMVTLGQTTLDEVKRVLGLI